MTRDESKHKMYAEAMAKIQGIINAAEQPVTGFAVFAQIELIIKQVNKDRFGLLAIRVPDRSFPEPPVVNL